MKDNPVVTTVCFAIGKNMLVGNRIAFIGCKESEIGTTTATEIKKFIANSEGVPVEDVFLDGQWGEREAREAAKQ